MNSKILLSSSRDFLVTRTCRKKIMKIHSKVQPQSISSAQKREYLSFWRKLQRYPSHLWLETFQYLTGIKSNNYVAEDIYYNSIEPVLNFKPMSNAETCKNLYYKTYPGFNFPAPLLLNENGVNYDSANNMIPWSGLDEFLRMLMDSSESLIVKPALDSGGGTGVRKFDLQDGKWMNSEGKRLSQVFLKKNYGQDFIIQSKISQSRFFSQFNDSSVNTLRIFTYRSVKDESIHVIHTLLRIGKKGSITDNQASGGISMGVQEDGTLNNYAIDKYGTKCSSINGIDLHEALRIENIAEFHRYAINFAKHLRYSRLLGLDLTMDDTGKIVLIEVNNSSNEINFFQMSNGPLFGDYTKEILDYCISHPRSYCFDYSL